MTSKPDQTEKKLEKLAHHLRQAQNKLHPVEKPTLEKVREAVTRQWENEYKDRMEGGKTATSKTKSHEKDEGHSH